MKKLFGNLTKKKNNKGFTLIEIIVVLVILAILAAAGLPTMLGFISDSRGKALIAEARTGYVAAQAVNTEFMMASGISPASGGKFTDTAADTKFDLMLEPDLDHTKYEFSFNDEGAIQELIYTGEAAGKPMYVVLKPNTPAQVTTEKPTLGSTGGGGTETPDPPETT